ncbi:Mobile element protein [Candidatus Enterovibrio escicola]|uniref:Mobile element protein n=1 Tax=Candidatus Enterovibrio escicola TaxID=1927127 RepID=A0A2A5T4E1_9GAMM|nr:Mobile element protein [Candidatus Enterovibrio escacola]
MDYHKGSLSETAMFRYKELLSPKLTLRHCNGFSYKMTKSIPSKFDLEKQRDFIRYYDELKAFCIKEEPVLFIDAVHSTQAIKIIHRWISTVQDKSLATTEVTVS